MLSALCSVVAKVYQLRGAAGFFLKGGKRGDTLLFWGFQVLEPKAKQ